MNNITYAKLISHKKICQALNFELFDKYFNRLAIWTEAESVRYDCFIRSEIIARVRVECDAAICYKYRQGILLH